jgi:hypothetical protein
MPVNEVIPPPQIPFDPDGSWDSRYLKISSAIDSDSVALTVDETTLQADVQFAGSGSAETAARSDHNHTGVYDPAGTGASAVSTHAALTGTHGVTGAIVGTGGTQTLTGKTLTSPTLTTPTISSTGWGNANHAHSATSSGGQISHTNLTNIGTNTHAQIDTHMANTAIHYPFGAFLDILIEGHQNAATTAQSTDSTTATVISATSATFPAGTWSGMVTVSMDFSRSVGTGGGVIEGLFDGVSKGSRLKPYQVSNSQQFTQKSFKLTGITAGSHTFGIQGRGDGTAGTTYMFNAEIRAHFWRTA